jgi:hypothetical protein
MCESSGSTMDSKFSLIFDSGVDVDPVSAQTICKCLKAEKAIEKWGVYENADTCGIS